MVDTQVTCEMSDLNAQVKLLRDEQESEGKLLEVYTLE